MFIDQIWKWINISKCLPSDFNELFMNVIKIVKLIKAIYSLTHSIIPKQLRIYITAPKFILSPIRWLSIGNVLTRIVIVAKFKPGSVIFHKNI